MFPLKETLGSGVFFTCSGHELLLGSGAKSVQRASVHPRMSFSLWSYCSHFLGLRSSQLVGNMECFFSASFIKGHFTVIVVMHLINNFALFSFLGKRRQVYFFENLRSVRYCSSFNLPAALEGVSYGRWRGWGLTKLNYVLTVRPHQWQR